MITLDTKTKELNRVGPVTYLKLKRIGIETIRDLIFYYPFRYEDFSNISKINDLEIGSAVTVIGQVDLIASRRSFKRKSVLIEAIITDSTGSLKVIWFNQPWILKNIKPGDEISLSGKVAGDLTNIYLNSPDYEKNSLNLKNNARLIPIYPLTQGLTQKQLSSVIKNIIELVHKMDDYLPLAIIKRFSLISFSQAISKIHFPKNQDDITAARERLAFDELFFIQLWSKILKRELQQHQSFAIDFFENETKKLVDSLPFKLTNDQRKTAWEIILDMKSGRPMNRLVEGDVGSGKTMVAAISVFNVGLNNRQSAFLAPTEILARQHFDTLYKLFGQSIRIGLLTRTTKIIDGQIVAKKDFISRCQSGQIDLVIGTHALIQKDINFNNLALVIVDEQHRFGVAQREAIKQKSQKIPHFLSLTATPIPRSLALTVYGDLDLSIIKELPAGRKKIITQIIPPEKRQTTYDFIRQQVEQGRQIFVVCPLIDQSDSLGAKSVIEEFEKLHNVIFPDIEIGILHGKMKTEAKDKAMTNFVSGHTQILVSTSVIEVGVDIKNATVMMIEGADRFGLAQLHQFRGRVGRNDFQSYCFLFSDTSDDKTIERLQVMTTCHDGFELAKKDLQFRGAGHLYGYMQSGLSGLKIATLDDVVLAKSASLSAEDFLLNYDLDNFPIIKEKIDSMNLSSHLE